MMNAMLAWGLVLLVGFIITQYSGIDDWTAWIAWLIILVVGNIWVGKTMKKAPKEVHGMWTVAIVLAAVLTLASLAQIIPFSGDWLMALWLLAMGAPLFAGGIFQRMPGHISLGLIWIVFALWIPVAFGSVYFLIGGLILGIPMVVGSMMKK